MYSKNEASKLKEEFWTTFGKYMSPVPSAEGLRINWINYKTGVKDIRFFMEADGKSSTVGIRLSHQDSDIQELFFEEFLKLRDVLGGYLQEEWIWTLHDTSQENQVRSMIYMSQNNVSIFLREQWPELISFLKPRIIALDAFWNDWKYAFEDLM